MAVFSDAEKIDVLIKSSFGVTSTDETLPWYNEVAEPFNQYTIGENILIDTIPSSPVFDTSRNPSDIGLSSSDFHSSNNDNNLDTCSIVDDSTGTVRRFRYLLLDTTTGTNNAGRSWTKKNTSGNNVLHNSLAFNYKQDGSYAPYESKLYRTNGSSPIQIGPSTGSWSYNTGTGILFFADYEEQSHVSTSNPPAFLVYVYIGQRGIGNLTVSSSSSSSSSSGNGGSASSADGDFTVSGDIIGKEDLELNGGIILQDGYIFDNSATRLYADARFENIEVRDGLTVYGDLSINNFNVVKNVTFSGDITSDTLNTANIIQFDQTGTTLDVDLSGDVYRNSITTFGNIDAGGMIIANGDISANGNLSVSGTIEFGNLNTTSINAAGGNVGIGVTNPGVPLDISGGDTMLRLRNLSSTGRSTMVVQTDDASWEIGARGSNASPASSFYIYDTAYRMIIDASGNVGIGTTSPASKLHIYDNTSNTELLIGEAGSTDKSSIIKYTQGDGTGTGVLKIGHYGDNIDSDKGLSIKKGGNVGIGTTSAIPKLDVNGAVFLRNETLTFSSGGGIAGSVATEEVALVFNSGTLDRTLALKTDSNANLYGTIGSGAARNLKWKIGGNDTTYFANYVGIGTTTPNAELHIHQTDVNQNTDLKLTHSTGGSAGGDGFDLVLERTSLDAYIIQREYANMRFKTYNTDRLIITSGGNVGIGTTSVHGKMEIYEATGSAGNATAGSLTITHGNVNGHSSIVFPSRRNYNSDYAYIRYSDDAYNDTSKERSVLVIGTQDDTGTSYGDHVALLPKGLVGIGTNRPTNAKVHIVGSYNMSITGRYYTNSSSSGYTGYTTQTRTLSIYTDKMIATQQLHVFSDRRIKKNITEVPDNLSLQLIRDLPIRYYNYIDEIGRGTTKVIGFIAQEVNELIPTAVSIGKDTIPDEYRLLEDFTWEETEDGKFKLTCDLQDCSGITYLFKVSNNPETESEDINVVGNDDNTFTFKKQYTHIFLYGREVDDFHRLDKHQIFAVGMSALQEVDRQQQADKIRITNLEAENATLKTQMADVLARLATLETA